MEQLTDAKTSRRDANGRCEHGQVPMSYVHFFADYQVSQTRLLSREESRRFGTMGKRPTVLLIGVMTIPGTCEDSAHHNRLENTSPE